MTSRLEKMQSLQFIFSACLALLFFASACGQQAPPSAPVADQIAVREADALWSKTAGTRDLDATVAFYADDASLLAPNAPIATDKKTIRDIWAQLLVPQLFVSWEVSKVEVARSGDLAYLVGTYQIVAKDPKSKSAEDRGKMVEVWKKQADGKWKCIADIFNSDLPLAPAAPPPDKKK